MKPAPWTDETDSIPYADFHATWISDDGQAYAVGGNFLAPPAPTTQRIGVVGHFGLAPPSTQIEP